MPSISIGCPFPRAATIGIMSRVRRPDSPTFSLSGMLTEEPAPLIVSVVPVAVSVEESDRSDLTPAVSTLTSAPSALATSMAASFIGEGGGDDGALGETL